MTLATIHRKKNPPAAGFPQPSASRPGYLEHCATELRKGFSVVQRGTTWYNVVQRGTASYSVVQRGTAWYCVVQRCTAVHSGAQRSLGGQAFCQGTLLDVFVLPQGSHHAWVPQRRALLPKPTLAAASAQARRDTMTHPQCIVLVSMSCI